MSNLRASVAKAIQHSEDCGGAGIFTDEEEIALETALVHAIRIYDNPNERKELERYREAIAGLIAQLGKTKMRIHGLPSRIDAYYLKCADIAIEAYDKWLDERKEVRE